MDSFADATGYGGAAEIVDPEPFGKARRLHRRLPHVGAKLRVRMGDPWRLSTPPAQATVNIAWLSEV